MARTITIRLREDEVDMKQQIAALKKHKGKEETNPYGGRSESDIAKMLLESPLEKEYVRICKP
jgi:hypothetical protein